MLWILSTNRENIEKMRRKKKRKIWIMERKSEIF